MATNYWSVLKTSFEALQQTQKQLQQKQFHTEINELEIIYGNHIEEQNIVSQQLLAAHLLHKSLSALVSLRRRPYFIILVQNAIQSTHMTNSYQYEQLSERQSEIIVKVLEATTRLIKKYQEQRGIIPKGRKAAPNSAIDKDNTINIQNRAKAYAAKNICRIVAQGQKNTYKIGMATIQSVWLQSRAINKLKKAVEMICCRRVLSIMKGRQFNLQDFSQMVSLASGASMSSLGDLSRIDTIQQHSYEARNASSPQNNHSPSQSKQGSKQISSPLPSHSFPNQNDLCFTFSEENQSKLFHNGLISCQTANKDRERVPHFYQEGVGRIVFSGQISQPTTTQSVNVSVAEQQTRLDKNKAHRRTHTSKLKQQKHQQISKRQEWEDSCSFKQQLTQSNTDFSPNERKQQQATPRIEHQLAIKYTSEAFILRETLKGAIELCDYIQVPHNTSAGLVLDKMKEVLNRAVNNIGSVSLLDQL